MELRVEGFPISEIVIQLSARCCELQNKGLMPFSLMDLVMKIKRRGPVLWSLNIRWKHCDYDHHKLITTFFKQKKKLLQRLKVKLKVKFFDGFSHEN